jgi:hypothetical protein
MGHRSRGECFRAIYARYRQADRKLKQVILNEFCADAGYHRKCAIRQPLAPFSLLPRIIPSSAPLQNSCRHNEPKSALRTELSP